MESLFRSKNILFFIYLGQATTVRSAAKRAGISVQNSAKLLRKWRAIGLVVRSGTLHGTHYTYTAQGKVVLDIGKQVAEKVYGKEVSVV